MVEENSLNNPITRDIFRSAVMSGAPNGVKQAMEGNPDIPVATNEVWERHLVFHIDRTVDKLHKDEEELEKTKNQLLKLQLDLARASGPKKTKQMSQQSVNEPTDPSPVPPYFGYDQGWSQRGNWGGNRGQRGGNMGFRGRRGRGGEPQRGGFFCVVAMIIGKGNVPQSKGAANSQGHLQGDGVLSEVDLVVVAGDHMPHDTRGNSTRLQPTYRRLCTQHGARRETRGTVEGAHRGPP